MFETGIQLDEKHPLYQKVAGKIIFLIEQGTLWPVDKISSIRTLTYRPRPPGTRIITDCFDGDWTWFVLSR